MKRLKPTASRCLTFLLAFALMASLLPPLPAEAAAFTVTRVSNQSVAIYINGDTTLEIRVNDPQGRPYAVDWSYDGISSGGLQLIKNKETCQVIGREEGEATVTAQVTIDGENQVSVTFTVVVRRRVPADSIIMHGGQSTITLPIDKTHELSASIGPEETTDTSIVWNIGDGSIARLSAETTPVANAGGKITITPLKAGTTTITAYVYGNTKISHTCTLIVTTPPTGIVLDSANSVVVGKTLTLKATVMPTTASSAKVVWFSSDDTIARVDYKTGVITGLKVGKDIIITAAEESTLVNGKVVEGTTVYSECKLDVTISAVPVVSLTFNNAAATVIEKKTTPLVVNITPTNATNKKLYLTSSDITYATVPATVNAGASFNVTGVKPTEEGKLITITARSDETNSIIATCEVTVILTPTTPVTAITLSATEATLVVGGTVTPKATLTPTGATVKTVTWASSDNNVATVDTAGKVTATGPGVATIKATAIGSDPKGSPVYAECKVNVLSLNQSPLSLRQDASAGLQVENLPLNSGLTVTWATNKTAVATISAISGTSTTVTAQGAGEAIVTATVKRGSTVVATLNCPVSVTSSVNTISYQVVGNGTALFKVADFTSVCTTATGNALSYVKFNLPSASVGNLYYLYEKTGETRVTASNFYYQSTAPKIGDVSFVPASTFSGSTTLTYTGVDVKGNTYTGQISILVGDATGDIKYSTEMNKPVTFSGADFNEFSQKVLGNTLNSVKFTLPKTNEGVLYYMYSLDSNQKVLGTKITNATYYFYNSGPNLDDITFLPANNFIGNVEIAFSGRDSKTNLVSGTVRIAVGQGGVDGADIEYRIAKNEVLDFERDDFSDFCKSATGDDFNYVQFTLPYENRGTLYYDYSASRGRGTAVTESRRYYRNSSPYLRNVSFVPYEDYEGRTTIKFTGMSTGGQAISGTIAIIVGDGYGDIRYSAGINVPIHFDNEAFNEFSKGEVNANFEYIQFTLPKATEGVLYHQYGRSGESTVTATSYRRTADPRLDEITFIPVKDFTGVVEFAFTGKSVSGQNLSGTVALTYDPNLLGMPVIHYSTEYAPVTFRSNDFVEACSKRGEGALTSVKFILPPANVGKLYEGYQNHNSRGDAVSLDTSYTTGSGAGSISSVTFLPRATTTGSVSIPYTGTDAKGAVFTGYVHISIPTVVVSSFSDMDKHTWAAASVEYLRSYSIVSGLGSNRYGPGDSITRGDFMLMLYRAFALTPISTTNFSDVPANSYYAQAIATGRAMGIALGGSDGRFNPNSALSRQDAMVLIHRMLTSIDRGVDSASESYLNRFSDARSVSSYARTAVADLINAGVIQGDGQGRLTPLSPVTRAEMAVILHRVLTM